jgi:hypothetical protein
VGNRHLNPVLMEQDSKPAGLDRDARVHFWPPRFDFIAATIRQWSAPGSESRS